MENNLTHQELEIIRTLLEVSIKEDLKSLPLFNNFSNVFKKEFIDNLQIKIHASKKIESLQNTN